VRTAGWSSSLLRFSITFLAAYFGSTDAYAQRSTTPGIRRVPEFGRPLASVEDTTAIVVNPANLAFMPSGEFRWTGVFLGDETDAPYSGHAFGLAAPIPFINVTAGVRLDLMRPRDHESNNALANYHWLSWALAVPMGRNAALGATLESSYSDATIADDLTAISVGFTTRMTNWLGLGLVGHNLNRPRNKYVEFEPRYEAGLSIRPFSRRMFELAFESAYLRDADTWIPKAIVGLDIGPLGRLRGEYSVTDPTGGAPQVWQAALSMGININTPQASAEFIGGAATGTQLGPSDVYSPYFSAATRGFREPVGVNLGRYGVKVLIEDTPDGREHVALLRSLWALAKEQRVDAVVVQLRDAPGADLASVEELRDAFFELRRAGKRVICQAETLGLGGMYLCSAANRVAITPSGDVRVAGLRASHLYLSELLSHLGVKADFIRAGNYKSAPEQLTRREASDEARENRVNLMQQAEVEFTTAVALGRNLKPAAVRERMGQGPFLANDALQQQLVDAVVFEDQMEAQVAAATGRHTRLLDDGLAPSSANTFRKEGALALVYIDGELIDGNSAEIPLLGIRTAGSYTLTETFEDLRNDRRVKAVVVRVDTPGGSSSASDALWRAIELTARTKPTIVSMGGTAASGGYYLAAPATRVFANPSTLTGSIGVFYGKADLSGLLSKIGVDVETYKTHPRADAETWFRPFTDGERSAMTKQLHTLYDLFLARVAEGRNLTKAEVDKVAQGRVWTGRQAVQHRLADEVGGLRQALAYARKQAGLSSDSAIIELPVPERSLIRDVMGLGSAKEEVVAALPVQMRSVVKALAPLTVHSGDKAQARLEMAVPELD
jgi:protease IV